MHKSRSRTVRVRCCRGVNRLDGAPETGWECRAEAVPRPQTTCMPKSPWWSVCEAHDPTGEPGAGNRHAGFGEQGLET